MKDEIQKLLERRNVYGDYKGGCMLRGKMMNLIKKRYSSVHGRSMPMSQEQYIYSIVDKLSRIAATPDHQDSWRDVIGYGTLILRTLRELKGKQYATEQETEEYYKPSKKSKV